MSAEFHECTFSETRLSKVDFQGGTFADCSFDGELDEVLFHRHAFRGEAPPPNEMRNVDFSHAQLRRRLRTGRLSATLAPEFR